MPTETYGLPNPIDCLVMTVATRYKKVPFANHHMFLFIS